MGRELSTFVISITPFDDEERLDEHAFRLHLRRLADAGIGVYVGGGGSGEGYALSPAETRRVLEIAVEELRGRVPVRAMGVEPRTARQTVELARTVAELGLDAMQVYSLDMGHGNVPRPAELERYFADILDEVRVPAVISTHQSVGYQLPIDLLVRLAGRYDSVIGINCTNPDVRYLLELVDALEDRVAVHVGGPMQAMTALSFGASGFLSSEGNLAPRLCVAVIDSYRDGDITAAAESFTELMRLFSLNMQNGGLRCTKAALRLLGLPGGIPRRPRLPITDAAALEQISATIEAMRAHIL